MKKVVFLLCLSFLLVSCASNTHQVLLKSDFTYDGAFPANSNEYGSSQVEGGLLKIKVEQPAGMFITKTGLYRRDVSAQVSGLPQTNEGQVHYGLICRMADEDNLTAFSISTAGDIKIIQLVAGVQVTLAKLNHGDKIPANFGDRINLIKAECAGNELTYSINGVQVLSAIDPVPQTGDTALFISSNQPPQTIFFDSLLVTTPIEVLPE